MVRNNTIKNCPFKPTHITNALTIFGLSIAGVLKKTVHCKPEQVEAEPGCIPDNFLCLHRFVVMTAKVMFVNGTAFLTMLSRKLWLATVKQLPSCTAMQLSNSLIKIFRLYACTGFIVRIIMMNQEFNKVKDTCKMANETQLQLTNTLEKSSATSEPLRSAVAHSCWTPRTLSSPTRLLSTLSTLLFSG
jgi:hypothetical protein